MNSKDVQNVKELEGMVISPVAFHTHTYEDQDGKEHAVLVIKDGKTTLFTVGYYLHTTALSHEDDQDDITVLNSITLKGEATNAWQTAVGDYYELIVLSQASQVAGLGDDAGVALDTAFDVISGASCAKWFALVLNGTVNGTTITVNP